MARILISMKDNFLKTIDEMAEIEQRTRSEFVREAIREYIKNQKWFLLKKLQKTLLF